MRIWIITLAVLSAGCFSGAPSKPVSDLQIAAQAEWAYAVSQLGIEQTDPPSVETDSHPLGVPGGGPTTSPSRPVICAYAPAWSKESQEFLEWYETSADALESLPFVIEIVPDEQIPEGLKKYPAFTCGDKGTLGWKDIETLQAELLGDSDGTP